MREGIGAKVAALAGERGRERGGSRRWGLGRGPLAARGNEEDGARDRAREASPGARVREGVGRLEVDGPVDGIRGRPRGEGKGLAGLLSPY